MQKLPEASDGNRSDACAKKNGTSRQKEKSHSLPAVTSGVTTFKSPLLLVEGHVAALKRHVGWTFTSTSQNIKGIKMDL